MMEREKPEDVYHQAIEAYENGLLNQAEILYAKSIEMVTGTGMVDNSVFVFEKSVELSRVLVENDQTDKVEIPFYRALSILKEMPEVLMLSDYPADYLTVLGDIGLCIEDFNSAAFCYDRASKFSKEEEDLVILKCKKYYALCRCEQTKAATEDIKLLLEDPNINDKTRCYLSVRLADIWLFQYSYRKALDIYESILASSSTPRHLSEFAYAELVFNKATALFETGRYMEATESYSKVIRLLNNTELPVSRRLLTLAYLALTNVYLTLSDITGAKRILQNVNAKSLQSGTAVWYDLAMANIELQEAKNGLNKSEEFIEKIKSYVIDKIRNSIDKEVLSLQFKIHAYKCEYEEANLRLQTLIEGCNEGNRIDNFGYSLSLLWISRLTGLKANQNLPLLSFNQSLDLLVELNWTPRNIALMVGVVEWLCFSKDFNRAFQMTQQFLGHFLLLVSGDCNRSVPENAYFQDYTDRLKDAIILLYFSFPDQKDKLAEIFTELFLRSKGRRSLDYWHNDSFENYHQTDRRSNNLPDNTFQWRALQSNIKNKEAAIAYFRYFDRFSDEKGKEGYGIIIITPNLVVPEILSLDIDDAFLLRNLPFLLVRNFKEVGSFRFEVELPLLGRLNNLYIKLIGQLFFLTEVSRVYCLAEGLLEFVPFEALMDNDQACLADKVDFIRCFDLLMITNKNPTVTDVGNFIMLNGLPYEQKTNDAFNHLDVGKAPSYMLKHVPAAIREFDRLKELFRDKKSQSHFAESFNISLLRTMISEKSPNCIHILTHGYFFNDEQKKYSLTDITDFTFSDIRSHPNPLIRSGLFASDYNVTLQSGGDVNHQKGIVTSWDIALTDLSKVNLVTIHACESAIGAVCKGESYGLAKAFRMAGVRCVILTLWKIQFTPFYEYFYQFLLDRNNTDIRGAFNKAISKLRSQFSNPYWWAGFVLIE